MKNYQIPDLINEYFSGDAMIFIVVMLAIFYATRFMPLLLLGACIFIVGMHMLTEKEGFTSTPSPPTHRVEDVK